MLPGNYNFKTRTRFQKGHAALYRREKSTTKGDNSSVSVNDCIDKHTYVRLTHETHRLVTNSPLKEEAIARDHNRHSHTMLLRPKKTEESILQKYEQCKNSACQAVGNRIVDMTLMATAYHEAQQNHIKIQPACCNVLLPRQELEVQRGLGVEEVFGCNSCGFCSKRYKLYSTQYNQHRRPGRAAVAQNVGLQIGLHNTSIASAAIRRLLSCLDITVPSRSGLQKAANRVGPLLEQENLRDMQERRFKVKDILEYRGFKRDTPISTELDRQYNNPLRSGRKKTPFAPATQTRDILIENVTADKYVIMYNHENKICSSLSILQDDGTKSTQWCPGRHSGCTATLPIDSNIGDEKRGGLKIGEKLLSSPEPLKISKVTTDADGHGTAGIQDVMQRVGVTTESLLDTVHLNRTFFRKLSKIKFSNKVFPSLTCKKKQTYVTARLVEDLGYRIQSEISAAQRKYGVKLNDLHAALKESMTVIDMCYAGNHSKCKKVSLVCNSNYKFPYLPKEIRGNVKLTGNDKVKLLDVVNKRTIASVLQKTRYKSTSQKAESVFSALKQTNPKHSVTFSRNACYRDHSGIHLINCGPGVSVLKKLEAAGVPLRCHKLSASLRALKQMQHRRNYHKFRSRASLMKRRAARRRQLYEAHAHLNGISTYKKDQLISGDHNYTKK